MATYNMTSTYTTTTCTSRASRAASSSTRSSASLSRRDADGTREEPTLGASSGSHFDGIDSACARKRRRHSSYTSSPLSSRDPTNINIQQLLDRFLADLGKRLEMMETYGHGAIDEGVRRAHATLHAVHEACVQVSGDVMDAGRRRGRILIEVLEGHYQGALGRKDTLEQKVQEGVRFMEAVCEDLERRAYDMRAAGGLTAKAHEMIDSGKAYMDTASSAASELVNSSALAARRAKEKMKEKIERAIAQARTHGVISYDMLPEPWRVNPHITSGYRFSETKLECILSPFTTLSNETVNIWSHAIGLIIILTIAFYIYPSTPAFSNATGFDILIASTFFFAACKCLVCSTMWHTMNSISNQTLMERFACVDYTGISLLVAASIMTTEYTAFYCEPLSRWVYLSTTFLLGTAGTILPWHPTFNRADMAWARVGFYVTLATTGFIPIIQLTLQRGWDATAYFYAPITRSILVYLTGALLYAAKLPERWRPGWFDYVGGSHNIWHMAVLGGILYHYVAMQSFFGEAYRRAGVECRAPP